MKTRVASFSFRGFVALADVLFAVSAGLLMLDPALTREPPFDAPGPAAAALVTAAGPVEHAASAASASEDAAAWTAAMKRISAALQEAERRAERLEAATLILEQQARLVLRSER